MIYHLTNEQLDACRRVRDAMTAAGPEHFDMTYFGQTAQRTLSMSELSPKLVNECGYAACLAGWAVVAGVVDPDWPTAMEAARSLGMLRSIHRGDAVHDVEVDDWFYVTSWPHWALDLRRARLKPIDRPIPDGEMRLAEYATVVEVLDDLIHGRRINWFDDTTDVVDEADLVDAHTQED